jgi:hypothetical protein
LNVDSRLINGRTVYHATVRCMYTGQSVPIWWMDGSQATFDAHGKQLTVPIDRWTSCHEADSHRVAVKAGEIDSQLLYVPSMNHPKSAEIARLREMGLFSAAEQLAERVGYEEPKPFVGLFSAGGTVRRTRRLAGHGIDPETLAALLRRHVAGDLGDLGPVDQAVVSDDARYCPPLCADLAARSAVAIESGRGLVFSRYPYPPENIPPNQSAGDHKIVVITAIVPGQPERNVTLISAGLEGALSLTR